MSMSNSKNGTDFFDHLKSKSHKVVYDRLFDYMKMVSHKLSQEQPFYVLNLADILWKVQLWKRKFPGITPFYAVKANFDPVLMKLFVLLGLSFDCSTKGEIDLVLKSGGSPKRIIYAHTIKPSTSLQYADEVGVDFMTFDCGEELIKIKQYFPNAKLLLRIKPDNSICSFDLSEKYGCPALEAETLLKQAKDLKLNVIGVSFHVGGLCEDPSSFTKSISNCRSIFDIAKSLGFHFHILDLGAGFFGSTCKEPFFEKIATEIRNALDQYFPENNVRIIAEPGCYFVGSAQKTVTCVLGRKIMDSNNSMNTQNGYLKHDIQIHYYLNDGYYGSFFKQFDVYDIFPKPLLETEELESRPMYKSKLWGQTCCAVDVVIEDCQFPEMKAGEFIVWENMGAYTNALCSTFTVVPNPEPKYVFIKDKRLELDWIEDLEKISNFIAKEAILIEKD